MMKISIALLALLALALLSGSVHVEAWTSNTWVNNLSSKALVSSITYKFPGNPEFTNRHIAPGSADHDQYEGFGCMTAADPDPIQIFVCLDGSTSGQIMTVSCDESIVALDRPGTANQVDIFNAVYGDINTPNGNSVLTLS